MRTVAWLKEELEKFPDDAICWAYSGECTGITVVVNPEDFSSSSGFIFCSEGNDTKRETETFK